MRAVRWQGIGSLLVGCLVAVVIFSSALSGFDDAMAQEVSPLGSNSTGQSASANNSVNIVSILLSPADKGIARDFRRRIAWMKESGLNVTAIEANNFKDLQTKINELPILSNVFVFIDSHGSPIYMSRDGQRWEVNGDHRTGEEMRESDSWVKFAFRSNYPTNPGADSFIPSDEVFKMLGRKFSAAHVWIDTCYGGIANPTGCLGGLGSACDNMQRSYNGLLATDLVIGLLTSTKSDCIRFKSADKNSDGKIDSKELTSYLSLKLAGEKIHTEYSRVELPGDPAFDWFKEECARRGGSISGPFDEFVAPKILVQEKTGPKEVFLDAFTQGLADQIDAGVNTRALDKAIEDLKDGELAQIWEEIRGLSQEPGVYASELLQELRNEMLALEQKIADLKAQKFQKLQPARGALQEILDLALRRGDASLLSPISLDRIEEILRYYSRKVKNPPFAVLDQSEGKQFYMCTYTTARELFPFENGEEAEVCPVMKGFAIHAPWCK